MSDHPQTFIVEFVPNPAAAGRVATDTELLQRAMDRMKVIADENHRLRQSIMALRHTSENEFKAALAAAIAQASAPLPYTLADFLPALRMPVKEAS